MADISVDITSPPDREHLVADIMVDNVQFAEINQEGNQLSIEVYPRPDGRPWVFPLERLQSLLTDAGRRLAGE